MTSQLLKPSSAAPKALKGFERINRYWDKTVERHAAKLLPGEFYVTTHDELIVTVLGSCISACICDTVMGIGGMNHFMLPSNNKGDGSWGKDASNATRYGTFAMEHLINEILKNGGSKKNMEVKLVGGGKILAQMTDVGRRNIEFIHHFVQTEGLKVVKEDLGDIFPRKVRYFPMTGRLQVKKLRSMHNNTVYERENSYMTEIDVKPIEGDIELF
jgi:chemotaxis protein CheD